MQPKDTTVRKVTLLEFRDIVVLKVAIEGKGISCGSTRTIEIQMFRLLANYTRIFFYKNRKSLSHITHQQDTEIREWQTCVSRLEDGNELLYLLNAL